MERTVARRFVAYRDDLRRLNPGETCSGSDVFKFHSWNQSSVFCQPSVSPFPLPATALKGAVGAGGHIM
jgi:hypothetical protein